MSRVVLLEANGLVAQELLQALEEHPLGRDVKLLSADDEQVGQLTEAAGAAALVARADGPAVAAADAIVVFGPPEAHREVLAERRGGATVVLAGSDATPDDGTPVVAGVNLEAALPGGVLVSPDAGAVLLSHLLAPLLDDGPGGRLERAVATLVQPASTYDRPGLDELFAQASRMVAMQSQAPSELFGDRQLAFNVFPAPHPPRHLLDEVAAVLGSCLGSGEAGRSTDVPPVSAHVLQGAVFHGYSALVHVQLGETGLLGETAQLGDTGQLGNEDGITAEDIAARLGASPWIDPLPAEAGAPAPIDVAGEPQILLAAVAADGSSPGAFWLWAVMDNLTRGGALNLLEILEAVLPADA